MPIHGNFFNFMNNPFSGGQSSQPVPDPQVPDPLAGTPLPGDLVDQDGELLTIDSSGSTVANAMYYTGVSSTSSTWTIPSGTTISNSSFISGGGIDSKKWAEFKKSDNWKRYSDKIVRTDMGIFLDWLAEQSENNEK